MVGEVDKEVAMEIFVFLVGLGCLVLFVWAIALFGKLVADRKYRRRSRPPKHSPSAPLKSKQQIVFKLPLVAAVAPRQLVAVKSPPVSSRVRLKSKKHQQYIRLANPVLKRLRDRFTVVQLPEALSILRKMNPYAFVSLATSHLWIDRILLVR